ncbi:beta-lactamase/transpeptidase-like protein [Dactylonectria estremocensis]|uniref:Beta-lactamase/transpeptidase-like protein n=1 Tax=Dactylonectria estremocensis TaxID=1079267 RepID=A0A9P9FAV3_9HYPO|nr:beta-lactamase/transpeptidase-like protein [Dactylonectria estremocensis]
MSVTMQYSTQSVLLLSLVPSIALATLDCRLEGPVLPKPTSLSESPAFQAAAANLTQVLDAAVSGPINAGWAVENTSFSLAVVSFDQQDAGVPVWEYHHLAEGKTRGTEVLGRDLQYLIGSISKVVAVYLLLKSGVDLDAPVVGFLPALGDADSTIPWQNVTLRMLASYLGGAPANYGFSEFYFLKDVFLAQGLPPIDDSDYPPCGVIGLNSGCSNKEFLVGMTSSYPVSAPMEGRPAYSNTAFVVLGMALEAFTGKNYTQLVREVFSNPLHLQQGMGHETTTRHISIYIN